MELTFTYLGVRPRDGRPEAIITLKGVLRDNAGKIQIKGEVKGFVWFDLASSQISFASVNGQLEISRRRLGQVCCQAGQQDGADPG